MGVKSVWLMNSVTMCDGCVAVLGGGKITVTIDADRHSESFCRVQVAFFKKPLLPLGERKTCLQVAFLIAPLSKVLLRYS